MPNHHIRRALAAAAALGLSTVGVLALAAPASAVDYTATTEAELVTAINAANGSAGVDDTIALTGTIALTADLPVITDNLTLWGPATIDGNGFDAIEFSGTSGDYLTGSVASIRVTDAGGAGIQAEFTHLSIRDSVVDDSALGLGHNLGSLFVLGSTFTRNDDGGAEILVDSDVIVTIANSHFDDNFDDGLLVTAQSIAYVAFNASTASGNNDFGADLRISDAASANVDGSLFDDNELAGIHISNMEEEGELDDGGAVSITRSTLTNNGFINTPSGGIVLEDAIDMAVEVIDTTISGNESNIGGAIFARPLEDTSLLISQVTASGNIANFGGAASLVYDGVSAETGDLVVEHSTFANNTANNNYSGLIIDWEGAQLSHVVITDNIGSSDVDRNTEIAIDHSLIEDPDFGTIQDLDAGIGNQYELSGQLGPLADNGGPTLTQLPTAGSPLINTGDPAVVIDSPNDQRGTGHDRIVEVIDIGAVEVQAPEAALAATGVDVAPLALGALGLGLLGLLLVRRRRTT